MKYGSNILKISHINQLRIKTVLFIAIFWTAVDLVIFLLNPHPQYHPNSILTREIFMFLISLVMGYLIVFQLRKLFRSLPLWVNFLAKSCILLLSALVITFVIQFINTIFVLGNSLNATLNDIENYALHKNWLIQKVVYWISIFFVTQLILIINEKYSPGVFLEIMTGRYIRPKVENRIIMFMDLKDSTPIAEKLGHSVYFEFIREFIYLISLAIIEFEGIIYQYVGDEVVCSWKNTEKNTVKCLNAVIQSRKNIQRKSTYFKRKYGIVPEFRVGINVGEVTVGEIGVLKKRSCDEWRHHEYNCTHPECLQ